MLDDGSVNRRLAVTGTDTHGDNGRNPAHSLLGSVVPPLVSPAVVLALVCPRWFDAT